MFAKFSRWWLPLALLLTICFAWQLTGSSQQTINNHSRDAKWPPPGTRFEFEVVESFDAKYAGDTPGHIGRAGGLEEIRPRVTLGDSVFRGDTVIGEVTEVVWARATGSLTVEFAPLSSQRISVGDVVWVDLNPTTAESPVAPKR